MLTALFCALAFLGGFLVLGGMSSARGAVSAADSDPDGCSYGTGGPSASTLCWLNFADFDSTAAAGGQRLTVTLPGNMQLSYTATVSYPAATSGGERSINAVASPAYQYSVFGGDSDDYQGVGGKPVLYQAPYDPQNPTWGGTITLSDIVLTQNGTQITSGWSMVAMDGESSNQGEGFTWSSDKSINLLSSVIPGSDWAQPCTETAPAWGSTSVSCVSNQETGFGLVGADIASVEAPTTFSSTFVNPHDSGTVTTQQGIAFALRLSRVQVSKVVDGRKNASDDFTVSATANGAQVTDASTGSSNSADSAITPLAVSSDGASVTFRETADNDSGTSSAAILANYTKSWACTDNDEPIADSDLTYSDDGTAVTTTVGLGDLVHCTVTNSYTEPSSSTSSSSSQSSSPSGSSSSLESSSPSGSSSSLESSSPSGSSSSSESSSPSGSSSTSESSSPSGSSSTSESSSPSGSSSSSQSSSPSGSSSSSQSSSPSGSSSTSQSTSPSASPSGTSSVPPSASPSTTGPPIVTDGPQSGGPGHPGLVALGLALLMSGLVLTGRQLLRRP